MGVLLCGLFGSPVTTDESRAFSEGVLIGLLIFAGALALGIVIACFA